MIKLLNWLLPILLIAIVLTFLLSLIVNATVAWSFLVGAGSIWLVIAYQAKLFFKEIYSSAAKRILLRFYVTELLKFIWISIIFVVLMNLFKLNVLAFVAGLSFMQIVAWLSILWSFCIQPRRWCF